MLCPNCDHVVYKKDKKCIYCGFDLSKFKTKGEIFCSRCKFPIREGNRFCQNCGAFLLSPDRKVKCLNCGTEMTGNYCSKCGTPLLVTEEQIRERNPVAKVVRAICKLIDSILDPIVKVLQDLIQS